MALDKYKKNLMCLVLYKSRWLLRYSKISQMKLPSIIAWQLLISLDTTATVCCYSNAVDLECQAIQSRVHCFSMSCNQQVFSPNPEKKFGADSSFRFREKCKKRTFNSEK